MTRFFDRKKHYKLSFGEIVPKNESFRIKIVYIHNQTTVQIYKQKFGHCTTTFLTKLFSYNSVKIY